MGLLGGTHCAGMCGGIVTALTLGLPEEKRNNKNTLALFLIFYNCGRILSYIAAGLLIASFSTALESFADAIIVRKVFTLIAATIMIFLGFYLTGWWPKGIRYIEQSGSVIWKVIEPFARKLIPVDSAFQAFIAGIVWGWLPCGLVYTALLWAMSAETILQGGLVMATFGIGTLPTLLAIGFFSDSLLRYIQQQWLRTSAGLLVIGFACYQLFEFM